METEKKVTKKWRWKWIPISLGCIVALILLILGAVSIILTPQRLTSLVNKYANEYFKDNADFSAGHVELTIWSTFPHAEIEVRDLLLLNSDPEIPAEGDTVASVNRFHGRINLAALLIGRISVNSVEIVRPSATLWQGPDSISNLDIFPPSEPKEEDNSPLVLPSIRLDRFAIAGDARFRYISVPDSLDADITIRATELNGSNDVPQYLLTTDARLGAIPLLPERLRVGLNGGIGWESAEPLAVSLHDFSIEIDSVRTLTSARMDFSKGLAVNELDFRLLPLPLRRVGELLPELPDYSTTANLELRAKLLKPYVYNPDTLLYPDMDAFVKIGPAPVAVPEYHLDFSKIGVEITAHVSNLGLDSTLVNLKSLEVEFPGSEFSLTGSATNLLSDPLLDGCFKGNVNFNGLDRRIWKLAGMRLLGKLDADIDFNLNLSDLTANTFHRARLKGDMNLRDFQALLPSDTIMAWTRHGRFEFGSSETLGTKGGQRIDSMLTARIMLDTARVTTPSLRAELARFKIGIGVENTNSTMDSTTITPMGGRIELGILRCLLADSSRAMVRGLSGGTILTRYKGDGKRPLLAAKVGAERIVFADGTNRASLSGAEIAAKAHLAQPKRERRKLSTADSLRLRQRRDSLIMADAGHERMDFGVDRSLVRMLKRWDVRGAVKAKGARLFTPVFPLRCRMRNLDFAFNPDTLTLKSMKLKAGRSDFALNGSVSNMQKSLGRKRGQPLVVNLNLQSDTINVNQLVQAAFRGSAWQQSADSLAAQTDSLDLDDDAMERETDSEASEEMRAIVVPMNVDATLSFLAKNIVYSTMLLHDFSGQIIVADGAAHLSDLQARTDIGSAAMNLLYYAPTVNDVDVGLSLELNRFRIDRVTELMPALDTLMPLLRNLGGIIDVNVGATTRADSLMNIDFPSLRAMVSMSGDSLKVLDEQTFRTMSKWLLFHDKKKNMIDHMEVELAVEDNTLELYPFMFDFDRYRIGVMGHNDLDMNLDYHVSILKSPIPFKFGVNVRGNAKKLRIRPGLARFKENMVGESVKIADTLRVNLAKEIKGALKRGTDKAKVAPMEVRRPQRLEELSEAADTLSHSDSLYFIQHGLIAPPDSLP